MMRLRADECGQSTVVIALVLPVLMGFVGLGVDLGALRYQQRKLQVVADAGALAGAGEISTANPSNASYAASVAIARNNYVAGVNGNQSPVINLPPLSGPHTGDSNFVEIIISQNAPTFFARIFGVTSASISARAVGGLGSGSGCIYVLSPTGTTFSASGGAIVNSSCGIFVDSSNSQALSSSGGACVSAPQIGIVGGYSIQSNGSCNPPQTTPTTGMTPASDPLGYVQPPTWSSCTHTGTYSLSGGGNATIDPGVYCGGINVSGGSTLKLNPGTYILNGQGLNVSGGSNIKGSSVTFYNTCGSGCVGSYGPIQLSGGSTTTLSAPTSGSMTGILFFQDRSINSATPNTVSGGSGASFEGALYFSTTTLNYSGGSKTSTAAYTAVVAKSVSFSGGSGFNSDYSSLSGGSPIKRPALME